MVSRCLRLWSCLLARSNSEQRVCVLKLIQGGMPQHLLSGNDPGIALDCGRAGLKETFCFNLPSLGLFPFLPHEMTFTAQGDAPQKEPNASHKRLQVIKIWHLHHTLAQGPWDPNSCRDQNSCNSMSPCVSVLATLAYRAQRSIW